MGSQRVVSLSPVISGAIDNKRIMPTHFYVNEGIDIKVVTDFANSRFIYSNLGNDEKWSTSKLSDLKRPHAITYYPEAERYFAVDTDNHQVISLRSFDDNSSDNTQRYSMIGGFDIGKRPHDIAYNDKDKRVYIVLNTGILRFKANDKMILNADFISKSKIAEHIVKNFPGSDFRSGYIRSLTIVDGVLFLSNSTQGNIIRIGDFLDPKTWSVKTNKKQPKKYAEKGSFDRDGLIINDVEYFNGYWYASNYYAGNTSNFLSEASVSKNKLIRWSSWEAFENSEWEDLSQLVHPESVTYNFTKSSDRLFLSMFHNGNKEGKGSGVYEIDTWYF